MTSCAFVLVPIVIVPWIHQAIEAVHVAEVQRLAACFTIESFAVRANETFGGTYPELVLSLRCTESPRTITIVFHAYTAKGKVFRVARSYQGPTPGISYLLVAAYNKDWVSEHGTILHGRVEVCSGLNADRDLLVARDTHPDTAPKAWWKVDVPQGALGFYKGKVHPADPTPRLRPVLRR